MTQIEKMVFCTLFDSNYLDKGLALYRSMEKHIDIYKLYICAFDDKCFEILSEMRLRNVTVFRVEDFMTDRLEKIQEERTRAEFCWTCTPLVIEHILLKYKERMCTYIDADIYFFASPSEVIQEIIDHECSVGLVEHRFERDSEYGRNIFTVGKYCIQFNTFLNEKNGMLVLRDWKESCLRWCYSRYEDGKYGDQKYSDKWMQKYSHIYESKNLGAGIAPWNLQRYSFSGKKNGKIWMKNRNRKFWLIFYHFEGMKYYDNGWVFLNIWKPDAPETGKKIKVIYREYFETVASVRKFLAEKYHITFEHMNVDKESFLGRPYSVKQFCMDNGVLDGIKKWAGYWKHNILAVDRWSQSGRGNRICFCRKRLMR